MDERRFRYYQIENALKMGNISERDYTKLMSELDYF